MERKSKSACWAVVVSSGRICKIPEIQANQSLSLCLPRRASQQQVSPRRSSRTGMLYITSDGMVQKDFSRCKSYVLVILRQQQLLTGSGGS